MYLPANFTNLIFKKECRNMLDKQSRETASCVQSMPQGGMLTIYNTQEVKNNIMKWALLCAITKYCIAPLEIWDDFRQTSIYNNRICTDIAKHQFSYHHCHRCDQSVLFVITHNYYKYESNRYMMAETGEALSNPSTVVLNISVVTQELASLRILTNANRMALDGSEFLRVYTKCM